MAGIQRIDSVTLLNPWLAVNYALIFPGLGQLYSCHWLKGGLLAGLGVVQLGYAVWSIFGANGQTLHGLWAIAAFVGLYSFSILDAYRGTQPRYANRIAVPKGYKDPWYAVFLSQILPGLGHLYTQQEVVGGCLLIVGISVALLANSFPVLVPLSPLIWAFSCYHVYATFPHRDRYQPSPIALLVLGLFLVRLTLGATPGWIQQSVEQCVITSESMLPTLQVGDRLFVRRDRTYHPKSGDIVVFDPPLAAIDLAAGKVSDLLIVKRLIGLPGQQIQIANRQVYVNGQLLPEGYLNAPPTYQWGPHVVPSQTYFVLGDNRNSSHDSHVWGYLPAANVLGKAYKIYWPPARVQALGP